MLDISGLVEARPMRQEQIHQFEIIARHGEHQRRPQPAVRSINISPRLYERHANLVVRAFGSQRQRRMPMIVPWAMVRAGVQQEVDNIQMALARGLHKRRVSPAISPVYVGAPTEQKRHSVAVSALCSLRQGSVVSRTAPVDQCSLREQKRKRLAVALPRRHGKASIDFPFVVHDWREPPCTQSDVARTNGVTDKTVIDWVFGRFLVLLSSRRGRMVRGEKFPASYSPS